MISGPILTIQLSRGQRYVAARSNCCQERLDIDVGSHIGNRDEGRTIKLLTADRFRVSEGIAKGFGLELRLLRELSTPSAWFRCAPRERAACSCDVSKPRHCNGLPFNFLQFVRRRKTTTQTEDLSCHRHLKPFKSKAVSLPAGVPDMTFTSSSWFSLLDMNSLQVYLVMKVNSNPPQAVIAWRSGTEPVNKWLTNYLFKRMLRPQKLYQALPCLVKINTSTMDFLKEKQNLLSAYQVGLRSGLGAVDLLTAQN